jgi:lipopolysaccharide/colanic/teichoic acid biosynthesis glycosyltransferase
MDNEFLNKKYSPYLYSTTKRCFDILGCLLLLAPTVLVLSMLTVLVLIVDGWPVFFIQRRVGKNGRQFYTPKIRTLRKTANPNRPTYSYDVDAFTTNTGKFLRKYRLDELPQIFVVMAGRMSLVGPRPELPDVVKNYSEKECRRFYTSPGLTGLWQIKASRNQPIHKNIRYDLYYLRKASLWFDIKILAATVPFVLKAESDDINENNCMHTYNLPLSE